MTITCDAESPFPSMKTYETVNDIIADRERIRRALGQATSALNAMAYGDDGSHASVFRETAKRALASIAVELASKP